MHDVLAWSAGGVAAVSSSSDVVEVPIDPSFGGPSNVFVKCYRYDRFEHRIKQAFRGTLFGKSRAYREFEFLTEMRRRQIPTVRPIAYGDDYGHAFLRASFLITEGSDGFRSLDVFALEALRRNPMARSKRRKLAKGLGNTIRNMHEAGIRHGGLYWRNILVCERHTGEYEFLLLDPDTHGRMSASRIPDSDVVADLSELVASGMALGQRTGLLPLMTAYFQVSHLTDEQKRLTSRIIERARTLAPSERRRMAVTEAIGWLRQRATNAQDGDRIARTFVTVDDFFDGMRSAGAAQLDHPPASSAIRFSFADTGTTKGASDRTVILDGDRATVIAAYPAKHDLVIRTDPETWLAVISGHSDAYPRLRAGRLRMEGDPTVLCALIEHLDRQESTKHSAQSSAPVGTQAKNESHPDPSANAPSQHAPPRGFGRKYKADDYARYYAEKHASSMGRRISTNLERAMIRRALLRIRRRVPFDSVLDCPSGTGRFLPTLASLNVSAIAMDTSAAVLREGRKHHALFKAPPIELVGSAFAIALPDRAVDVVLCSRLLHHIPDRDDRLRIVQEFARVARVGVVISFFDSASLRAWKRKRKTRRSGKQSGRHAITRAACVEEAVEAGLEPIGMNALLRFHTEITAAAFLC